MRSKGKGLEWPLIAFADHPWRGAAFLVGISGRPIRHGAKFDPWCGRWRPWPMYGVPWCAVC